MRSYSSPPITLFPNDAVASRGGAAAGKGKANHACSSCRKQKRGCDKALPACELCRRMGRPCDYSEPPPQPSPGEWVVLKKRLEELEDIMKGGRPSTEITFNDANCYSAPTSHSGQTPQMGSVMAEPTWNNPQSEFPTTLFLDQKLFRWSGLAIPNFRCDIPQDIRTCISDGQSMEHTLADYFEDIHPWLPIVSKRRSNPAYWEWDTGSDSMLLYLAMKLVTSQAQDGFSASENYLYAGAKRFLALLETHGIVSLVYLQALILIALYEYGQGIYPAAWMTVGQCVRYSDLIGLPSYKDSISVLGQCPTWVDAEERRRTWWAVYILDRIVSLGSQKRPMCGEPSPNEFLPVSDTAWDTGDLSTTPPAALHRPVSSPLSEPQTPYGRLCQSALLIGRLLRYSQRAELRRLAGERPDYAEVAALAETASSLDTAIKVDFTSDPSSTSSVFYFSLLSPRCLAYSTLLKSLSSYSDDISTSTAATTDDDVFNLHLTSLATLRKTSHQVAEFASDLVTYIALSDEDMVKTSPFVLDALYAAASFLVTSGVSGDSYENNDDDDNEDEDEKNEARIDVIKRCLVRLCGRWRLGAELLKALEHYELSALMGVQGQGHQGGTSGTGRPTSYHQHQGGFMVGV